MAAKTGVFAIIIIVRPKLTGALRDGADLQ